MSVLTETLFTLALLCAMKTFTFVNVGHALRACLSWLMCVPSCLIMVQVSGLQLNKVSIFLATVAVLQCMYASVASPMWHVPTVRILGPQFFRQYRACDAML